MRPTRLRDAAPAASQPAPPAVDPVHDTSVRARAATALLGLSSFLTIVSWAALSDSAPQVSDLTVTVGVAVAVAVGALVHFHSGRRTTSAAVAVAIGQAAITCAIVGPGGAAAYVPPVLFAAYFGSRLLTIVAVVGAAAAHGVALTLADTPDLGLAWVLAVAPLAVTAPAVRWLRDRIHDLIRQLAQAARQDALTHLLNRCGVEERLVAELARSARTGQLFSVLVADLDGFKALNDRLGHRAGDAALVEVARILEQESRRMDAVGRLGGDEFVVVMPGVGAEDAAAAGGRLCVAIRAAFAKSAVRITLSVGAAVYPDDGETAERLLDAADAGLYHVKGAGGGHAGVSVQNAPRRAVDPHVRATRASRR
jgi:diguanylate cyclase (GGDEF)-like protein